jgi:aspartate racemase
MKIIGMIGGMSWESSLEYYRLVNQRIKERLGGFHSAKCLMYSVDFAEIETLQHQGQWDEATAVMVDAGRRIERGGADFLIICTNTMHLMADDVQKNIGIPLIHIADATAQAIKEKGLKRVGLLGTRFTMEQEFYKGRLSERHGIQVIVPDEEGKQTVHDVIYNELCMGTIKESSRARFKEIIAALGARGAEGVILGCTEIPLLITDRDTELAVFDTTAIHASAAVDFALEDD